MGKNSPGSAPKKSTRTQQYFIIFMPRARAPGPGPRRGPLRLFSGSESQAQVVTELTLKHWQVKVQEFRD